MSKRGNQKGATPLTGHCASSKTDNYSLVLPAVFALAHRAFANAESLALAAALIFFLGFAAGFAFPLIFAHLALAAAEILARAEALILLGPFMEVVADEEPRMFPSSFSSFAICSLRLAARLR